MSYVTNVIVSGWLTDADTESDLGPVPGDTRNQLLTLQTGG